MKKNIVPLFDLVSVPSLSLRSRFTGENVLLQFHGINKDAFLGEHQYPESYSQFTKNIVFAGNSYFDLQFIDIASSLFPDYGFHLIGPISYCTKNPNVKVYGEVPFVEIVPYLIHADVGLQIRRMKTGPVTLSDSLKILQYTWCNIPIIAPYGLNSDRKHVIYYKYDDPDSIQNAVINAVQYDRSQINRTDIKNWDELVTDMLRKVEITI